MWQWNTDLTLRKIKSPQNFHLLLSIHSCIPIPEPSLKLNNRTIRYHVKNACLLQAHQFTSSGANNFFCRQSFIVSKSCCAGIIIICKVQWKGFLLFQQPFTYVIVDSPSWLNSLWTNNPKSELTKLIFCF